MEFKNIANELETYGIYISNGWNLPGLTHSNVDEMTEDEKNMVVDHLKIITELFKKAYETI